MCKQRIIFAPSPQLSPTFIKTWTHLKFLVVFVGLHPKAHWNPDNTSSIPLSITSQCICTCIRVFHSYISIHLISYSDPYFDAYFDLNYTCMCNTGTTMQSPSISLLSPCLRYRWYVVTRQNNINDVKNIWGNHVLFILTYWRYGRVQSAKMTTSRFPISGPNSNLPPRVNTWDPWGDAKSGQGGGDSQGVLDALIFMCFTHSCTSIHKLVFVVVGGKIRSMCFSTMMRSILSACAGVGGEEEWRWSEKHIRWPCQNCCERNEAYKV